MQAILVKYLGPTNTRPSRFKASCASGSLTLPMDYAFDCDGNARKAAEALCEKLGWLTPNHGRLISGALPSGDTVFVFERSQQ